MSAIFRLFKSFLSILIILFRHVFYRVISSFLMALVLFFVAILMYVTFYQAYMPVVAHIKPVYLQFSSDCQSSSTALCSYPEAGVFFTTPNKANDERMLMRGQMYKVFLDIEMPPSPTNEKLGMFMINIKFLSSKGTVLKSSSRSCMLHYESSLVRLFRTLFYSLPLTLGITEEKQKVEINFFDEYIDDSYNPAVQAKVVIMTKQVEIYSSTLRLQASFTGLRYVIFNWPVLFACFAVLGNFMTITLVYSACVNQFSPTTTTSTNQEQPSNDQQSSVSAQPNGILPNSPPVVAEPTTLLPVNVTMSNSVDTTSMSTPRSSTCRPRKSRVNGKPSIRIKFQKKKLKIQNSIGRRTRNLDEQHQSEASGGLLQETIGESSSYFFQDKMENPYSEEGSSNDVEIDKTIENTKNCKKELKRRKNPSKRILVSHSKKDQTKENATIKTDMPDTGTETGWDGFGFSESWETFKLPRIQRIGINLQENMLSFTRRLRHCTSDLELSSAEERRLIQTNCTRRSASTNDLTIFSTTVN